MKTGRTLQPEDRLSHYVIVGPLGAGGMGEVYLAQDSKLDRSVAVKVLPHEVIRNEERVRRFVLEAKSASSLNHPNIVTIYEIGQDVVRTRDNQLAEPDSGPVHFISMELVTGDTLANKIHQEKTDLRTLLGYMAQAAEGIAKAHAAGIVHRDLKPGNIMVSKDGFAKVLDFGLAKLTEKPEGTVDLANAPTMDHATSPGLVVGTVGYMSPEQVQGKAADARSDIFSFGCILYEAATRRKPFVADSDVETMHKIVHEKPAPVEELNAEAPAELRRVIRRCLAKSPEQRFQSMKDIAIELREIADEYDTLSRSATAGSSMTGVAAMAPAARRRLPLPVLAGLGAVVVAALALAVWALRQGGGEGTDGAFRTMRVSSQTNAGNVVSAALSKDGRFLAYTTWSEGRGGLRVRQVATGSDREMFPTETALLAFPSFSPDGNYLYYMKRKPETPIYMTLFRVPSLGGSPEELTFDVDSRVSFSPDGRQCAFQRFAPQERKTALVVLDLDTRQERELAGVLLPQRPLGTPSWSPDGKQIATALVTAGSQRESAILLLDASSGRQQTISVGDKVIPLDVDWLSNGRALVLNAIDWSVAGPPQLYLVAVPGGKITPVTNDAHNYTGVTAASGDQAIAAVRTIQLGNIWIVGAAETAPRQITSITNAEHSPWSFATADNDRVHYVAPTEAGPRLWSIPVAGGEPAQLATGNEMAYGVHATAGVLAYMRIGEELESHIWRANTDGSNSRQLTSGNGERVIDVSGDGRFATFAYTDSSHGIWLLPLDGGEARLLAGTAVVWGQASFSPDDKHVCVTEMRSPAGGMLQYFRKIVRIEDGAAVAELSLPSQAELVRWAPDGAALTYVDRSDKAGNIYRQAIGGGSPQPVTRFQEGVVSDYRWSPDGRLLAVARDFGDGENLWITAANGSNAKQATSFTKQQIFEVGWMPDSGSMVVRAGTESRDAVLIRNFR